MAEFSPVSQIGCVRWKRTAGASSSGWQSGTVAESAPSKSAPLSGRWGFNVALLAGFRGFGVGDPFSGAQQEAGVFMRFSIFERRSLEGDHGVRVTQGVTNRQFALHCLSTRPVPSASQDVRAGFLFGGFC